MNTSRLIQLSSQLDQVLEFRVLPDGTEVDEDGSPIAKAAGGALVAGGVGAGAYYGNRAVQAAGGYGQVAGNIGERVSMAGAPALGNTIASVPRRTSAYAGAIGGAAEKGYGRSTGGAIEKLLRALKGGTKAAMHTRFQSREDRLINLSAQLDEVLEFKMIVKDGRFYYNGEDRTDEVNAAAKRGQDWGAKANPYPKTSLALGGSALAGGLTHNAIQKRGGYKAVGKKVGKKLISKIDKFGARML